AHVASGLRLPAKLAVGGAQEAREFVGREAVVGGGTLHLFKAVAGGRPRGKPGRELGFGGAALWVARNATLPLAFAIAGHRWPLPRQDRRRRQATFIGRHGRFARPVMLRPISFLGRKQEGVPRRMYSPRRVFL